MFARMTHFTPAPILRIASGFTAAITTLSFAATVLVCSPVAQADAAMDWNAIAADAIATATPPRPGPIDSKKHYVLWRPVTAIQEGENDGNPATAGHPGWQPLLNTLPYPEYSSGANNVTGALTRILVLFFGKDDMPFTVSSLYPQAAQKTRTYSRFSEMASDMVDARIYQGIHFRFGDEAGRDQGTQVAEWVFSLF